jgi:hypothetical protein
LPDIQENGAILAVSAANAFGNSVHRKPHFVGVKMSGSV